MKIGILTFHRAHNYGAMLQAYALHRMLSLKGHTVEFLSYRNEKIESAYKMWRWHYNSKVAAIINIKTLISEIITFTRWQKRRKAFKSFAKQYLPESKKITKNDIQQKSFDYDALFFGSDQIWTTRFLKRFDTIYWGEIKLSHGVKIAYAPSMELTSLDEIQKDFVKRHLPLFDAVSVRETYLAEMLSKISGTQIRTVLDPTFLCMPKDYQPLIQSSKIKQFDNYLLVYQVGDFSIVHEIADYLANIIQCPIIEIRSNVALNKQKWYKEELSPADFVSLIANATFVLTCSFHGTAFAVNFHKPFYSVLIKGMDTRAASLLEQTGLTARGIYTLHDINKNQMFNLNYKNVEKRLDLLRKESLDYIDNSLKLVDTKIEISNS